MSDDLISWGIMAVVLMLYAFLSAPESRENERLATQRAYEDAQRVAEQRLASIEAAIDKLTQSPDSPHG